MSVVASSRYREGVESKAPMLPSTVCILVVEDHSDNRLLLTFLLRSEGYGVVAASSYAEALSLVQDTAFDLYLLDHWLGDGNGQELREKLRERHPTVPALFCTTMPYTSNHIEQLRQNGDDFVHKPSPSEKLVAAVANLLLASKN